MADTKISGLPAAASAAGSDQLEANQSGVSRRVSIEQVLNALSPLIQFNTDGSASFANSVIAFGVDGAANFGAFNIHTDGSLHLGGGFDINADGSASFANGGFTVDTDGALGIAGATAFAANGSASFANGSATITSTGGGTFSDVVDFGSASFANGVVVIDAAGDLEITNTGQGVILRSPDNTRYRIKVSDLGVLSTETV